MESFALGGLRCGLGTGFNVGRLLARVVCGALVTGLLEEILGFDVGNFREGDVVG